jgi:RNA polymerase sigma factor (sigma-70 family)
MNGTDLLAEFKATRGERAFGELVRRYTNLVYSVAKRRLSNGSQAEEVTQTVFIRLAKAVPNLRSDAELVAWLHRTTVHASIDLWRSEFRRRAREEHAAAMQPATENPSWDELSPFLDEALNSLTDSERQAILLRFFEQRSMRELGLLLGISEDAAKMRVSRAMDRLRTAFTGRGVTCASAALSGLLLERSVEAAPAGLVIALASLQLPAPSSVGAASSLPAVLGHLTKAKLLPGFAVALLLGTATVFWLRSHKAAGIHGSNAAQANSALIPPATGSTDSSAADTNTLLSAGIPDPLKLLQDVALARNRIASGEIEFEVTHYEQERPLDNTNLVRLKARFDGNKRRFEASDREYRYTALGSEGADAQEARRQAEHLDHEASVRAGLLQPFDSYRVSAFDGTMLMTYREADGKPENVTLNTNITQGGDAAFDPRCLGLDPSPIVMDTIESCLSLQAPASARLLGEEIVHGVSTLHVAIRHGWADADFWVDSANPVRVLKYAFNGSVVTSKYDPANPRDPIPVEVIEKFLHGTTGTQTAFSFTRYARTSARFNIPIDPASWTLEGLGMKIGTSIVDMRNSRIIGYWDGVGISETTPSKPKPADSQPDRAGMLELLADWPASPQAADAAQWVILNTPDGPDVEKAADVLIQEHILNTNLVLLPAELERLRHHCTGRLLDAMLQRNPSVDVRGNACFSMAALKKDEAQYGLNQPATTEAQKLFERVVRDFGSVKRDGSSLASLAKPELADLQQLAIGQPAPETRGPDLDGHPVSLSDYRGQVVLLIFWGKCCPPDMEPLLKLQQRFEGNPFAILGVYCDNDANGRNIADELGMTWPSINDGRNGPVSIAWNDQCWPCFQLIDANGIIRYRHLDQIKIPRIISELMTNSPSTR